MRFTKMHGIGNDYIYINGLEQPVPDPAALSVRMSRAHFGCGSDGLILILPSDRADFRMRMFNADGSESGMCGNGIRCVARYYHDRGLTDKTDLTVENGAMSYVLSILKNGGNETPLRYFYEYESPLAGEARVLHTYAHDGDPVPSFTGEPERVEIEGDLDVFGKTLWESLNEQNKVSLYVRFVDLASGTAEYRKKKKNA